MSRSNIGNTTKANNRNRPRRKKRRTEDFSSDSDSDLSSSSEDNKEVGKEEQLNYENEEYNDIKEVDLNLEDGEKSKLLPESLTREAMLKVAGVTLTDTPLSDLKRPGKDLNVNSKEVSKKISEDKSKLENQFLKLMASSFSDDLDDLRKKPDFTDKSLTILAKTLQSGSDMFDPETLNTILNK